MQRRKRALIECLVVFALAVAASANAKYAHAFEDEDEVLEETTDWCIICSNDTCPDEAGVVAKCNALCDGDDWTFNSCGLAIQCAGRTHIFN